MDVMDKLKELCAPKNPTITTRMVITGKTIIEDHKQLLPEDEDKELSWLGPFPTLINNCWLFRSFPLPFMAASQYAQAWMYNEMSMGFTCSAWFVNGSSDEWLLYATCLFQNESETKFFFIDAPQTGKSFVVVSGSQKFINDLLKSVNAFSAMVYMKCQYIIIPKKPYEA